MTAHLFPRLGQFHSFIEHLQDALFIFIDLCGDYQKRFDQLQLAARGRHMFSATANLASKIYEPLTQRRVKQRERFA
jgi:hypothetical protein